MEHMDELILKEKEKQKTKQNADIHEKVYIDGQYLTFSEQTLFSEQVSVRLPDSFIEMPKEVAKIKYPMEQRPQVIRTNDDSTVNFAFNLFDQAMQTSQVKEAADTFATVVRKMNPSSRMYECLVEPLESTKLGWFDFKTASIDQPVYTIMGVTVVGSRLFHIVFSCPHKVMEGWKPIALQVFRSIRSLDHT